MSQNFICQKDISAAIIAVRKRYIAEGTVANASEINGGLCDDFAMDVMKELASRLTLSFDEVCTAVHDLEYANLTGSRDEMVADEIFDERALSDWGYILPEGVSVDALNSTGLGQHGTHVFMMLDMEDAEPRFFDAECEEGVSSPFMLPYATRYLQSADKAA